LEKDQTASEQKEKDFNSQFNMKIQYTFDQVFELIDSIYCQVKESDAKIDFVSGVPRGGLILAVLYSHRFNVPFKEFSQITSFEKVLLIDDIADTGVTLRSLQSKNLQLTAATLLYRYSSSIIPDFYGQKIEFEDWIVFPWEKEDSEQIQDYLK
jgi:uncharacterized protein